MTKANLIGIGAQKCATTWLSVVLNAHPDVLMSEPKEVDFFSYGFDRGYEWYDRHFESAAPVTVRGEISPSYIYNSDAPDRVKAYNQDAKIVAVLRDPVERAFSNHLHEFRAGNISSPGFTDGMANNPLYLDQSRYAQHIRKWEAAFGAEGLKILLHEDIRDDPKGVVVDLCQWLGLQWTDDLDYALSHEANVSVSYKSEGIGQFLNGIGRTMRRTGLGEVVKRVKAFPPIAAFMSSNKEDLREVVPPLDPAVRLHLARELLDDMEWVAARLGRPDLPWKSLKLARET